MIYIVFPFNNMYFNIFYPILLGNHFLKVSLQYYNYLYLLL